VANCLPDFRKISFEALHQQLLACAGLAVGQRLRNIPATIIGSGDEPAMAKGRHFVGCIVHAMIPEKLTSTKQRTMSDARLKSGKF
jgi:hypothetical protein